MTKERKREKFPDHTGVYNSMAEKYERLISREDYQGNIPKVLSEICSFTNCDVIDMGAGTGRLTCLAAPISKSVIAYDLARSMLDVTAEKLNKAGLSNWRTEVADHRKLPVEDNSADIVMSGWSICYLGSTNVDNWQDNVYSAILEMKRVVREDGILIILETLGTGHEEPEAPDFLVEYYQLLETYGFHKQAVRTDYRFQSLDEAEELTRFFFGDELAAKVHEEGSTILPECTGVWWLKFN